MVMRSKQRRRPLDPDELAAVSSYRIRIEFLNGRHRVGRSLVRVRIPAFGYQVCGWLAAHYSTQRLADELLVPLISDLLEVGGQLPRPDREFFRTRPRERVMR